MKNVTSYAKKHELLMLNPTTFYIEQKKIGLRKKQSVKNALKTKNIIPLFIFLSFLLSIIRKPRQSDSNLRNIAHFQVIFA